jgi:8-oxo-dGTP pyrophosphatase MutT (NUDIX family)
VEKNAVKQDTAYLRLFFVLEKFQRLKFLQSFLLMREKWRMEHYVPDSDNVDEQSLHDQYTRTLGKNGAFFYDRKQSNRHATAALMILSPDLTKVLIMRHKRLNLPVFPGGHCDGWVNTKGTAVKEALEEVGGLSRSDLKLFPYPVHVALFDDDPADEDFDLKYAAVCRNENLDLRVVEDENDKVEIVGFVTFDELKSMRPDDKISNALDNVQALIDTGAIRPENQTPDSREIGMNGLLKAVFNSSFIRKRRLVSVVRNMAAFMPLIPK